MALAASDVDEIRKKRSVVRSKRRRLRGGPSPAKARKILADKEVRGKALTDRQRRFFHARANK